MTGQTNSEIHNALARNFVTDVAGATEGFADLMVVIESAILGAMLLMSRRDGLTPAASVEMIEAAVAAATERFAAANGRAK